MFSGFVVLELAESVEAGLEGWIPSRGWSERAVGLWLPNFIEILRNMIRVIKLFDELHDSCWRKEYSPSSVTSKSLS